MVSSMGWRYVAFSRQKYPKSLPPTTFSGLKIYKQCFAGTPPRPRWGLTGPPNSLARLRVTSRCGGNDIELSQHITVAQSIRYNLQHGTGTQLTDRQWRSWPAGKPGDFTPVCPCSQTEPAVPAFAKQQNFN